MYLTTTGMLPKRSTVKIQTILTANTTFFILLMGLCVCAATIKHAK